MDPLSIKIKIADREYPMKVEANDEAKIRQAGKLINDKIKAYRSRFGIDDMQDLLAMVAFDSIVEFLSSSNDAGLNEEQVLQKVQDINRLLSDAL